MEFTRWAPPCRHSLRFRAAPAPLSCFTCRLAPTYTTRKSRSIYSRVHLMGATLSPALHAPALSSRLARTYTTKTNVQFTAGFTCRSYPAALHSCAASPSIHSPALPSRLASAYTTKNKRSIYSRVHLMGATPSPSTPMLRRAHSTLLLRLATLLLCTRQK